MLSQHFATNNLIRNHHPRSRPHSPNKYRMEIPIGIDHTHSDLLVPGLLPVPRDTTAITGGHQRSFWREGCCSLPWGDGG